MGVPCTTLPWVYLHVVCFAVGSSSFATSEVTSGHATQLGDRNICPKPAVISNGVLSVAADMVTYTCSEGYSLSGLAIQRCTANATWYPPQQPSCMPLTAPNPTCTEPYVSHGVVESKLAGGYNADSYITVQCDKNYGILVRGDVVVTNVQLQCGHDGNWTLNGWPFTSKCTVPACGAAPEIPHAVMDMMIVHMRMNVVYDCTTGYQLVKRDSSCLVCMPGGEWFGELPSCVPVVVRCARPSAVPNAVRTMSSRGYFYQQYRVGIQVTYKCNTGYKAEGPSTLQCLQNGHWSHGPPSCMLEKEHRMYCPSVENVVSGQCVCETKSDLAFCEPFYQGMHVECSCNTGYKLIGQPLVTCRKDGKWDYIMPTCVEVTDSTRKDTPAETSSHMSTLAIVVATACSVLGVLLLTMVIMVFRRRKPHPPRLIRPSSTPPPYSRVHGSGMDEHDRVLLIGYENSNIQLPSYEEATVGRPPGDPGARVGPGAGAGAGQVGEYRPLPSLPTNYRSSQSVNGDASNRHSIITTSTMNRDGLSEGFGSIDTVNVSMSDASTAVTIGTLDSAGSHHSNISRRATAGSLSSSSGSIVTEDAPLLESNQRTEEIDMSVVDPDSLDKIEN